MKLCVIPRRLFETIIKLLYSAAKNMLFENSVEFIYLQLNKLTFLPLPLTFSPVALAMCITRWEDVN
jgi:hypothetical protein